MAETVYYRFVLRSYTAAEFSAANGILLERELGVELDTGYCKRGDGTTPWNDLGYEVLGLGSVDLSALADGAKLHYDASTGAWSAVPDDAANVAYDNSTSGLSATDVQAAIDEIASTGGGGGGLGPDTDTHATAGAASALPAAPEGYISVDIGGGLIRWIPYYMPYVTPMTWNPADKGANIVLSGGDLIVGRTGSDGWQSVRATIARSSGKHYFEGLVGAASGLGWQLGLASATATLADFTGSSTGFGYNGNGNTYTNGFATGRGVTYGPNDVISCAYDAGTGAIWFAKNGVWITGDPATGTSAAYTAGAGSVLFPTAAIYDGAAGNTWIGRFNIADFTYAPPSGFSAWG